MAWVRWKTIDLLDESMQPEITEREYAAFVKNERFKQTIYLRDEKVVPNLKVVK